MSDPAAPSLTLHDSGAAQQELAVTFLLQQPADAQQLQALLDTVSAWVAVGDCGGFVRSVAAPSNAALSMLRWRFDDPSRPAFLLNAQQLDPGAWQLLRHAAWRWGAQGPQVQDMRVIDRTPGGPWPGTQVPSVTFATQGEDYPPRSSALGFAVTHGNPGDYAKERRCVVDFGEPVDASAPAAAIAAMSDWLKLAELGAWALPVRSPLEAAVLVENLALYDEYSVELALSLFEASECAWYSLCNVLARISHDYERIAAVEFD
jgi:hypothetical protein